MKTFDAKRHYPAYASESRSILSLLGFSGILDFARRSAINHLTAAELLGTLRRGKHPAQIVRAWTTATESYVECRGGLNASMRKHVLDWMKRWRTRLLQSSVIEWSERNTTGREIRRREKRQKMRMLALQAALTLPGR